MIIRIGCVLVAGLLATGSVMAQSQKIVAIDLKKMFDGYWKTKQFNNQLQKQREDILKERNAIMEKLKKADEDYKKLLESANDQAISAEKREKNKKSAEEKLLEMRQIQSSAEQFQQSAVNTLQETEGRMKSNIVKELREAVAAKAKGAGYALVVDSSADSAVGTPIFLHNSLEDITESLLADINSRAPTGALEDKPKTDAPKTESVPENKK